MNKVKTICILLIVLLSVTTISSGILLIAHKDCIKAQFAKKKQENSEDQTEESEDAE